MLLFHFCDLFHDGCYGHYTHFFTVFLTDKVSSDKIMKAEMMP